MGLDKRWEIKDLNSINSRDNKEVTKSLTTFTQLFIMLLAILLVSPYEIDSMQKGIIYLLLLMLFFIANWYILKKNFFYEVLYMDKGVLFSFVLVSILFFTQIDKMKIFFLNIVIFYIFFQLLFNRNFILYDLLYKFRLKIKLITIEENLSPFSPLITQFERIILGLNKNSVSNYKLDLNEGIIFFWIRKDKQKSKERSINDFIPFLSLITILFVLKEKSYKFVAIVGTYFSLLGVLFISYYTFLLEKLKAINILNDNTTIAVITIFLLVLWYLLTIYNIYSLIDMSKYIKEVNKIAKKAKIKKDFNFSKGFASILETFERDNAVYIYDCLFDKYLHVNGEFLFQHLNLSKRLVDRNIAVLITVVISMVLAVFVEITANGVFQYNAPVSKTLIKDKGNG